MVRKDEIRAAERAVAAHRGDRCRADLHRPHPYALDVARWTARARAGWTGRSAGSSVFEPWAEALDGIDEFERLEVLYWLHRSRRDLAHQSPRNDGTARGTFALRSPVRPNPIGTSIVALERIEGATLFVRGLDCLDGTPLIDLKPDRCLFTPLAPPTPGDSDVGDP